MRKLDLQEIKDIEVEILDYINEICKVNNLKFFLDSGTLLGAVRHKGFIPWDDDIDIIMPRQDYEKLITIMEKKEHERFQIKTWSNTNTYNYSYSKIVDTSTKLIELDENGCDGYGVFVDVFPLDGLPNNIKKRRRHQYIANKIGNIIWYSLKDIKKEKGIGKLKAICGKLIGHKRVLRIRDNYIKKYSIINTQYGMNMVASFDIYREVEKTVFEDSINIEFEGKMYPAPKGYKRYLTILYGDYMKLPPEDQRISNHNFIAYHK